MGLQTRLVIWLVAMLLVGTVISVVMTTVSSEQRLAVDLQRRANLLGRSLEISKELKQALQSEDGIASNRILQQILSIDTDAKFLFLLAPNNTIIGWATPNPKRALELGITTPGERETILTKFFRVPEEARPLFERIARVRIAPTMAKVEAPAKLDEIPIPQEELTQAPKALGIESEEIVEELAPAQEAPTAEEEIVEEQAQVMEPSHQILVHYNSTLRGELTGFLKKIVLATVLPSILIFGIILFFFFSQLTQSLNYLKAYAMSISDGDLTHPFSRQAYKEVMAVGKSMDVMRRNFKKALSKTHGASRQFDSVSARVNESSQKITDDAINQSHAIRTTVACIDAMANSSTSVQGQISEATRSANESTEKMKGIGKSISAVINSMQLLSKSVDQTRRHLEGNISILGEVDRSVNKLQETATGTVAASSEIAENIRTVEIDTQAALRMSTDGATKADSGMDSFREAMSALIKIRANAEESANSIRFLSEKTASIEHILDVIDDISNRTKLLSLNASIIASHAGEAGRGFMIVAEEIKDLAARTAGSTREISKIISEVREGSAEAIEVVERGVRTVNEGVKRAEVTGEALQQIVNSTTQAGSLVSRISSSMTRQSENTKRVSAAMREVHSVVVRVREVVSTQKTESRDLEASIRTMRIQMSRGTSTAKQQMTVIQEAISTISNIFDHIQLISNSNEDQVRNQVNVSKAVDQLKQLSDLHHASASNLAVAVEQSTNQSEALAEGLKQFRL